MINRHAKQYVYALSSYFGHQCIQHRRKRAQQHRTQTPIAYFVSECPVRLTIGKLVHENKHEVIGYQLALGHSSKRSSVRCRRPDEECNKWRNHPTKGEQKEKCTVLKLDHPGYSHHCPAGT